MRIILPENVSILSIAGRASSVVVDILFEEPTAHLEPVPGNAVTVPISPRQPEPKPTVSRQRRRQIGIWAATMLTCFVAGAVGFHGGSPRHPALRTIAPPPEELGMPDPHAETAVPSRPATTPSNPWGLE